MCCLHVTTTTTTSPPTTPPSAAEDVENVIKHKDETTGSDVVQAQPSQIDEVVVKITGEAFEVKSNSTVTL